MPTPTSGVLCAPPRGEMVRICAGNPGRRPEMRWQVFWETLKLAPSYTKAFSSPEHLDVRRTSLYSVTGLEGVVAKRRDKPYRSSPTAEWVKIKNPGAPAATRIMEWRVRTIDRSKNG